jgi:hypothetical protein
VTLSRLAGTITVSLAVAAVLGPVALAGGEPKNETPFTRPATVRSAQAVAHTTRQEPLIQGEAKNQLPFTRAIAARSAQAVAQTARQEPLIQGEAKNQVPFIRPATVVVAGETGGFDWTAGGLGVVAGIGLALAGTGAVLVTRKSPQTA